ncbi:MAG TPA: sialidase family protein, partial [Bryobacterales bacterium]|nr:sialidase family protein [Bryobacterales bacterium]
MSSSTKVLTAVPALLAAVLAVAATRPASSPAKVQQQTGVTLLRVPDGGIQPQAAVDAKGVVHLIYFKGDPAHGDLFYVRSADGGATFSKPVQANSKPGSAIAVGNIRGARLAIGSGGRIHVAWNGSRDAEPKGPLGAPMLYARSNDSGTAFEPERNVIHTAWGLDGGGAVAADAAGDVYVLWHAPTPGQKGEENRRVWIARSTDGGKTFAAEKPAYDHPTGACGCCGLNAFADQHGSLYVLYRSATNVVNRDMYLLVSHNKGETFRGADISRWNV